MFTFTTSALRTFKNFACKFAKARYLSVLGIETSCDDTGIALLNENGEVLGNVLNSQQKFHARLKRYIKMKHIKN